MPRFADPAWMLVCALCLSSGCAHMVETRAITAFAEAVKEQNLPEIEEKASTNFKQKALRHKGALDDIRTLHLPTGELEIVHVVEDGPTRKTVTVEESAKAKRGRVGKRRVQFLLTKDAATGDWLVDDIVMKQSRKDVTAAKSVTEQMDLLLTVREVLDAWDESDRATILDTATPDFATVLEQLPPVHLKMLTRQAIGEGTPLKNMQPKAQLDEDVAVVSVPRAEGKLILTLRMLDERWRVSDVAVTDSRSSGMASARRIAAVVGTTTAFLQEFRAGNKDALSHVCTPGFYNGSLAPANLATVELPMAETGQVRQELNIDGKRADVVIEGDVDIVKIGMIQDGEEADEGPLRYLVEEVTIYELDESQEKRLSAVFTAHARMQLFAEALAGRQLDKLRYNSTMEFNRHVWEHPEMTQDLLQVIPMIDVAAVEPTVLSTDFQGPVTEVTVTQGDKSMTYVLRDRNGEVLVDDVLMPAINRPTSLKENLQCLLPVYGFTNGLRIARAESARGDITSPTSANPISSTRKWQEAVARNSSNEFNRLAWAQLKELPNISMPPQDLVQLRLSGIRHVDDRTYVMLGDEHYGVVFELIHDRQRYRVDEVLMMLDATQHVQLKQSIRKYLANYGPTKTPPVQAIPDAMPRPAVQTAEFFVTPPESPELQPLNQQPALDTQLQPAGYESVEDPAAILMEALR